MKENDFKEMLLKVLDEPELKTKIVSMIDASLSSAKKTDKGVQKYNPLGYGLSDSREERKLKDENDRIRKELADLKFENDNVKRENRRLEDLNSVNEGRLSNLRKDIENLKLVNRDLENAKTQFNFQVEKAQREIIKLTEEKNTLEGKNTVLERKLEASENVCKKLKIELNNRLEEAWNLYASYQKLPEDIKENFRFYFVKPSFESFVFGGADKTVLESLWDETKACIRKSRIDEAEILWDLFSYFLKMANQTYSEDRYGIVDIDGEYNSEFDYKRHQLEPGSIAQGIVDEIIIPGYTYQEEFIRKTVVRLK